VNRIVVAAACAAFLLPAPARASGFLAARFGGEHGHPTTSNPTAIYYNPAGLALATGTRLYLDGTFAYRTASYDRPSWAIDNLRTDALPGPGTPADAVDANSGKATLSNVLVSPFAAIVSDLGVENLGVALGFYVPFGGQSEWDKNDKYEGSTQYPGAVDGVNRWWSIDGTIRSLYFTGAGAYRFPSLRLSVGLALSLVKNEVLTGRARNSDGSDDLTNANPDTTMNLQEGRSLIDVSGTTFAVGGGVIWEPVENLFLGASYQSQPGFGEQQLEGKLHTTLGLEAEDVTKVHLSHELPDVYRLGARYRAADWEYRLFGEYVRWSVFERQCLVKASDPGCKLNPDGSAISTGVILNIPREWKDAYGVRGGVSHWLSEDLELFLGAGYDSNAASDRGIDAALIDMDKATVSLGGRFAFLDGRVAVMPTLLQVFYFERKVTIGESERFATPSRTPNQSGTYTQSVTALDLGVQYAF
jgi:long-chain fatty acid transport protein